MTTMRERPAADDWRAFARTEIEAAIADYGRARVRAEDANRRYAAAEALLDARKAEMGKEAWFAAVERWENWQGVALTALHAAQAGLIRAIVAWHGAGGYDLVHVEKRVFAPCAIVSGGVVYLATPEPDDDSPPGSGGKIDAPDRMHLLVMPAESLARLDTIGGPP